MVVDLGNTNIPYHAIPYDTIKYQIVPNISNSHKSVIYHSRSSKFCKVVDIDNTNRIYIGEGSGESLLEEGSKKIFHRPVADYEPYVLF